MRQCIECLADSVTEPLTGIEALIAWAADNVPDDQYDLVEAAEDQFAKCLDRIREAHAVIENRAPSGALPAHPAPDGDELRNLRRWKSEATTVLDTWDKVHEALGSPGLLGEHKSAASLAEIERRTAAMRQLIDDIAPPGGFGVADGTGK